MRKIVPDNAALIPDNATRVHQGAIFSVYEWPQRMFDGRTKTFEMLKRPDTLQIIVVRGSQILLVEDEQPGNIPRVHFPGGRADEAKDGDWLSGAQRELREETGLVCQNWRLVDVQQPVIKIEWFAPIFVATDITEQQEQRLDPGGEKITMQWYEFDDVRARVLAGKEQMMQYLLPFFNHVQTLERLLALPAFQGKTVER